MQRFFLCFTFSVPSMLILTHTWKNSWVNRLSGTGLAKLWWRFLMEFSSGVLGRIFLPHFRRFFSLPTNRQRQYAALKHAKLWRCWWVYIEPGPNKFVTQLEQYLKYKYLNRIAMRFNWLPCSEDCDLFQKLITKISHIAKFLHKP